MSLWDTCCIPQLKSSLETRHFHTREPRAIVSRRRHPVLEGATRNQKKMAPRAMVTALLGLFAVFSSVATAKSNVIILTNDNFEHLTQASTGATTGDWLVEFYAPWCGHCKKLEPVYEKVADELKGKVNVAKVDATAHSALGKRFEIQGYPTILLLRQGTVYKYSGPRTTEELSRFARSGYKTLVGHPVPTPSSLLKTVKHHVQLIQQDFASLMATKKNVLLVTFSGGLLVGVVLGWFCSCCSSRGSSASKKKSKTS